MKKPVIGVLGQNGRYGQFLTRFFLQHGYDVCGSDLRTSLTNEDVVKRADVVIFSILPTSAALEVIREMIPYSRPKQLWMDVASVKVSMVKAMLKSKAQVVGLHPMRAPTTGTLEGQKIIRCIGRLTLPWQRWLEEVLLLTKAEVIESTPDKHDKMTAVTQALPHALSFIMASVLRELNVDLKDSLRYGSPFYRIHLNLIGRSLGNNPNLLADLQMCNPYAPAMLRSIGHAFVRFGAYVDRKDRKRFIEDFKRNKDYFSFGTLTPAFELFDDVVKLVSDHSERMVTVEVADRKGVLNEILAIFSEAGVNLTSIHSEKIGERNAKFFIGSEQPKESETMKVVIKKIKEVSSVTFVQ